MYLRDALPQGLDALASSRRQREHAAAVRAQPEAHLRGGERERLHDESDRVRLRTRGTEKPTPHRQVEEEVARLDGGAGRARGGRTSGEGAGHYLHPASGVAAGPGRGQRHGRYRPDSVERLPPESQGVEAGEIVARADLARRVPGDGERGVPGAHPRAVVAHPDQLRSAARYLDLHPRGPGVQRVLDELLYRRGETLYDLPRRYAARDLFVQHPHQARTLYLLGAVARSLLAHRRERVRSKPHSQDTFHTSILARGSRTRYLGPSCERVTRIAVTAHC